VINMATTTKNRRKAASTALDNPRTPLYAVAGAIDLAVAALREVPGRVQVLQDRAVNAPVKVADRAVALPQDVVSLRTEVPARVKTLLEQVEEFVTETRDDVEEQYVVLAGRGKILVDRIRRQAATERLEEQVESTTRQAKAARTTVRKSAASTKRAVKATTTSASRTAEAAAEAVEAAADKVGN
jgi:heparin binding hemagglutinin HbhA